MPGDSRCGLCTSGCFVSGVTSGRANIAGCSSILPVNSVSTTESHACISATIYLPGHLQSAHTDNERSGIDRHNLKHVRPFLSEAITETRRSVHCLPTDNKPQAVAADTKLCISFGQSDSTSVR